MRLFAFCYQQHHYTREEGGHTGGDQDVIHGIFYFRGSGPEFSGKEGLCVHGGPSEKWPLYYVQENKVDKTLKFFKNTGGVPTSS